jgi:dihydroorotate dehydrogenase
MLGINVGANKDSVDRIADYMVGVAKASRHADYITINVSSPNTPGLRDLQARPELDYLLAAAHGARGTTPLFLKIAPDLDRAGIEDAVRAAIDNHVDALIVSNTTLARPALASKHAGEAGGLSGAPMRRSGESIPGLRWCKSIARSSSRGPGWCARSPALSTKA